MNGVTQKTELERLLRQIEIARKELESLELQKASVGDLTERISVLTKEKYAFQRELDDLSTVRSTDTKRLHELKSKTVLLQNEIAKLERQIVLLGNKVSVTHAAHNAALKSLNTTKEHTDLFTHEIANLQSQQKHLEDYCRQLDIQRENAKRELESLNVALDAERAELSKTDKEIADVGTRRDAAEREVSHAQKKLDGILAESARIEEQNAIARQIKADDLIAREEQIRIKEETLVFKEEQFSQKERLLGGKVIRLRAIKQQLQQRSAEPLDVEI